MQCSENYKHIITVSKQYEGTKRTSTEIGSERKTAKYADGISLEIISERFKHYFSIISSKAHANVKIQINKIQIVSHVFNKQLTLFSRNNNRGIQSESKIYSPLFLKVMEIRS